MSDVPDNLLCFIDEINNAIRFHSSPYLAAAYFKIDMSSWWLKGCLKMSAQGRTPALAISAAIDPRLRHCEILLTVGTLFMRGSHVINHDLKCIFVHIPRTAGTSIEAWLAGDDWYLIDPSTKHISARQAKCIYKDYWSDYLKFSFVRNPLDRVKSLLHYGDFYGVRKTKDNGIDLLKYHELFGLDVIIEHDHRYYNRQQLQAEDSLPGQVYGNILNENLDFIGRFENLEEDIGALAALLKIDRPILKVLERSSFEQDWDLNEETRRHIIHIYRKDIGFYYADLES